MAFQNIEWILNTIYPIHYKELIYEYSEIYDIDPYLIAAIMRNESKFDPKAISKKGAKGLMQIAPITGKWASEQLGIDGYNEEDLFEPRLNVQIGTWYLTILRNQFNNNMELMIAGYNAGNGNVEKWLKNPEYSSDGESLDEIPFGETKIYQKKVLRDYKIYKKIYKKFYN